MVRFYAMFPKFLRVADKFEVRKEDSHCQDADPGYHFGHGALDRGRLSVSDKIMRITAGLSDKIKRQIRP